MSTPVADAEVTALPSLPGLASEDHEVRRARDDLMQRLFGDPATPVTWGRYELRRRVGAGGMGTVYAVWDPQLGREVALKVISGDGRRAGGASELSLARLAREAQAMARINHPNVVPVYDVGRDDDQVYFTMELVQGASLDGWLARRHRTTDEILDVFDQIASGVAAAHRAGLLHRDLKPHNVLVGDDGRVRVADFGLARAVVASPLDTLQADDAWAVATGSGPDNAVTMSPELTDTGTTVGTPAYMSPEQHAGATLDARTDVYALSVALFVALFGALPFASDGAAGMYMRKAEGAITWPLRARPVPRWLIALLERGLQPSPERRFASMEALRATMRRGRRGKGRRLAAAVGFLAVAGVGAMLQSGPATRPCAALGDETIAAVWSEGRAADLERAFAAASPIGATQAAAASPGLHAWAQAWTEARRRSCEVAVATVDGAADLDDRTACLDVALAGFAAAVDRFERADAVVVERAVDIAARLGDPARCLDAGDGVEAPRTAADPRRTAIVERFAQLDVERFAGRLFAHVDELARLADEADAVGDPALRARAHLLLGHARRGSGDFVGALPELELAHGIALAGSIGALEEEAAHTLAVVLGKHLRRTAEALRWIEAAAAAIDRYDLSDEKRALLASDHGGVYFVAGELEVAVGHQQRAVALAESLPRGGTTLAIALNELGVSQAKLVEHESALATRERAVAAFEDALGPEHPLSIVARANLASSLRDVGRPLEAEPILERCVDALEHVYGPNDRRVVITANELGALRAEVLHDQAGALQAYARAYAGARHLDAQADLRLRSAVTANYGDVLWHVGRFAEALELHRSALAGDEDVFGPEHDAVADDVLRVGHDALALGLRDEARSALLRAHAIAERGGLEQVAAYAEFAQAWLARDTDPEAARTLAVRARDRMVALSPKSVALIDEWIAAQDRGAPLPADWRERARVQRLAVVP
jgi:tetratricopeptide (TPR) repeat protein